MGKEKQEKSELVQMTLAEASDLHDRAWSPSEDGRMGEIRVYNNSINGDIFEGNRFKEHYNFRPFSLSEIVQTREDGLQSPVFATYDCSGDVCFAKRGDGGKIEVIRTYALESTDWSESTQKPKTCDAGLELYEIFSQRDSLKFNRDFEDAIEWKHPETFTVDKDGKATMKEASSLPLWDNEGDYEKYLRINYGDERIDVMLREGARFPVISENEKIGESWKLLTPCLERYSDRFENSSLLRDIWDDDHAAHFRLIGEINLPEDNKSYVKTIDVSLMRDFVQPKDMGNGVMAFPKGNIPKYLERRVFGGGE